MFTSDLIHLWLVNRELADMTQILHTGVLMGVILTGNSGGFPSFWVTYDFTADLPDTVVDVVTAQWLPFSFPQTHGGKPMDRGH